MVKVSIHGVEIDSCTGCFGAWFKENELPEFLEKLEDGEFSVKKKKHHRRVLPRVNRNRESSFCPKCNQLASPYSAGNSDITVLKCINCRGIWVEPSQIGLLRDWYQNAQPSEKLSIRALPRRPADIVGSGAHPLKAIFNLVEDEVGWKNFPAITLFIILVNILLFTWTYFNPHKVVLFMNFPNTIFKYPAIYAYTLFSCMFLHAGLFHLFFNMYFLWVFGDNVEDRIGSAKFIIFYLSCGIVAGLMHTFLTSHPEYPTLGASGAVSGIMGGYLVLYPKAKLRINMLIFFMPVQVRLPVWFYLGVWIFGSQIVSAFLDIPGIAWYAHIGGFIFGFGLIFGMRKLNYL
jgi:membrane associated rhomboid family serine protease